MAVARDVLVPRSGFQSGRKPPLCMDGWLLIAAASLSVMACAGPNEGGEPQPRMGLSIQAIVGGGPSGADQDAVVVLARFENGSRVGLCTATLLAPNLVVTARHCVSVSDGSAACGPDGQPVVGAMLHGDRDPATLAVFGTANGTAPDTTTALAANARGQALVVDDSGTICNHDVAYVVLDRAIAGRVAPVRLDKATGAGASGPAALLTAVGFVITSDGALPPIRQQRGGLSVVGVGPMAFPDDARYGVGDAELLVGESACAGDSGSPLLSASGAVVGVASRAGNGQPRDPNNVASTCLGATAHAVYATLGADKALALRAFAGAKATPWLEGQVNPASVKPNDPKAPGTGSSSGGGGSPAGPASGAGGVSGASGAVGASGASGAADGAGDPGLLGRSGGRDDAEGASGGCNTSGEPMTGAVEDALGIIALALFFLVRLRRRDAAKTAADAAKAKALANAAANAAIADAPPRSSVRPNALLPAGGKRSEARIPYVDLGMRESLASISDDR